MCILAASAALEGPAKHLERKEGRKATEHAVAGSPSKKNILPVLAAVHLLTHSACAACHVLQGKRVGDIVSRIHVAMPK
jgi:hypothetical protein